MSKKKVVFPSLKDDKAQKEKEIDSWVASGDKKPAFSEKPPELEKREKLKKITVLVEEDLHTKLKIYCAESRIPMVKLINDLIKGKLSI